MGEMTDKIQKLTGVSDAEHDVATMFYGCAKKYAEKLIGTSVKSRVSASEVVNSAVRLLLKRLRTRTIEPLDSKEFRKLLFSVVKKKTLRRIRDARRLKRTPEREQAADEKFDPLDPEFRPLTEEVADKLAASAIVHLLNRYESDPADANICQFVVTLKTGFRFNNEVIRRALLEHFPESQVPSTHTIKRQHTADYQCLKKYLEDIMDEK